MSDRNTPNIFKLLLSDMCIDKSDITGTSDGFLWLINPYQTYCQQKMSLIFWIRVEKGLPAVNFLTIGFYMPFHAKTTIHTVF